MRLLKKDTAVDVVVGVFVDETDGKTPETALTLSQADCQLSKNAGAVAQKNSATAASHLGGGHYKVPLSATDTNTLGQLRLYINESGALPVWEDFTVVPANVYDALVGGSDRLEVHAGEITDGLIVAATLGAGAISAAKIADGAITAAKVATGAIDADALAADAVAEIADGVWDEALSGHSAAGSAGKKLSDSGGDPWATAVPGAYAAGTAGYRLGNGVNANQIGGSTAAADNAGQAFQAITYGAAASGTQTATQTTTNLTGRSAGAFINRTFTVYSGAKAAEQATITGYNSGSGLITHSALSGALSVGDKVAIS